MVLAICDPQGAIILHFKKLFLRDKVLAKKISRIYEFWTIKELLNACQSISFDCVIFSNEFAEVCFPLANTFFGNERELLIETGFTHTLFAGNIAYWDIARKIWKFILQEEERANQKIVHDLDDVLADYDTNINGILFFESKNHRVYIHLVDGLERSEMPFLYSTLDEIEKQPKLNAFIRIHKSYFVNAFHIKWLSNYKVMLNNGLCLNSSRGYFKSAKEKLAFLHDIVNDASFQDVTASYRVSET